MGSFQIEYRVTFLARKCLAARPAHLPYWLALGFTDAVGERFLLALAHAGAGPASVSCTLKPFFRAAAIMVSYFLNVYLTLLGFFLAFAWDWGIVAPQTTITRNQDVWSCLARA